jgi:Na+-driven multidrug efflux pump
MRLSYITLFLLSGVILLFLEQVVGFFNLSPESHDLAKAFLQIHCVSMMLGWTMSFTLPNALRAAGDARFVMVVAVISMWLVRVSFAYLLVFPLKVGSLGVWIAMGCDFLFRGICYLIRWHRGRWTEKKVIS